MACFQFAIGVANSWSINRHVLGIYSIESNTFSLNERRSSFPAHPLGDWWEEGSG